MSILDKMGRKSPTVSIKRSFYTMATVDGDAAEIVMYGDVVESQPVNPWTGEPIPGNYIIESEFLDDLQKVSNCKSITIRMNSCGGDAGVAVLIHNRLRELANAGTSLTCVVDGVAMSGGSLIMCACDTVRVNPSSLIMIHKCWVFLFGGYNSDELRQQANQNDAYDKSQVSIYARKTGLSDTVLMHMMGNTTYMTGKEAVEKGFADELMEDAEPLDIAASADGRSLFIRGRKMHLAPGMFAPDTIPTVKPEGMLSDKTNTNTPEVTGKNEGGNFMTLEEFRKEHPDWVEAIEAGARAAAQTDGAAEAVSAERARMQAIDEIAGAIDPAMVQEAKYGATACSAAELALRAAKAAAKSGQSFMTDLMGDAGSSGAAQVSASPADDPNVAVEKPKTKEARMEEARAMVKKLFHGTEGQ